MADVIGTLGGVPTVVFRDISLAEGLPVGTRYALVVDAVGANLKVGDTAVSPTNPIPVSDTWEIRTIPDEQGNDSDKVLTVPTGYEYQILWIWVELSSDAIAGNRQLQIDFRDAANDVIGQIRVGVVQAANLTRYYMFGPALADHGAFRDGDYLMTPLPPTVFLPAGYDIRIWDNNAVSVAGDDMVVQMQIARRAA